jgi:hypothetical protein
LGLNGVAPAGQVLGDRPFLRVERRPTLIDHTRPDSSWHSWHARLPRPTRRERPAGDGATGGAFPLRSRQPRLALGREASCRSRLLGGANVGARPEAAGASQVAQRLRGALPDTGRGREGSGSYPRPCAETALPAGIHGATGSGAGSLRRGR